MKDNKVEIFLRDFMSVWQTARIYDTKHPQFIESLSQAYISLQSAIGQKNELVIGIFGEEFASGEEIFFDLSAKFKAAVLQLKERNIEKIAFLKDTLQEELAAFVFFLITAKEEVWEEAQEYLRFMGVANIKIGKIGTVTPKEEIEVNESTRQLNNYKKSLTRLSQVLDTLVNDDAIDYLKLKSVTGNIMENLIGNYQIFFKLAQLKSYDTMTFRHLLNVSILAIYFSHQLGFRKEDCLNIGIGALFHDIGKLYIEKKIIQKPDKLDESEFDKIKNHAAFGAEILLRHIDTLQILPVVVAFEHHLGYDLKGYPKITFFRKPHIASLIIYICDVYDALAQRRTYKRDYPPEMIYAIMVRQKGKKFSPELLDKFFKIMGVWPKGTIVLLSDGRIAIVREENDDIFSPIVEIVSDTSKESINLALKKEVKIQRSLNPFSEGEKYLNFI